MLDDFGFFAGHGKESLWSFFIPNRNEMLGIDSAQTDRTYYRPLAHVLPIFVYRLFGSNVVGHHAVNMVLMFLAAVVIFLFLRRIPLHPEQRESTDFFAWAVAVLFIVHPINGILVNYITASVFSAQVIFMIGALYCLLNPAARADIQSTTASKTDLSWAGAVLCFVLALLCHETAVMLPIFALIVLRINHTWKECWQRILPLLIVLGVYFIFRMWAVPFSKSILFSLSILELTLPQKMATIIQLMSWYFLKLLAPFNIFLMWSTPFVRANEWSIIGIALLVGVAVLALVVWLTRRMDKRMGAFFAWFVVGLTPIAAGAFVTPYLGGLVEPHWFVLATVGGFAFVLAWINRIPNVVFKRGVMIVGLIVLIGLSWRNNHLWGEEVRYYESWLKEAPQFKAVHYFLGMSYVRKGNFDQAYGHLKESILGRYKDWMVYLELGQIDIKRGDLTQASEHLYNAYRLESRHSGVLNAVGALLYKQGQIDKAKNFFEEAIKSNPGNLEPYMNLGVYYKRVKEPQKAIEMYQKVLSVEPRFPPAQKALRKLLEHNQVNL